MGRNTNLAAYALAGALALGTQEAYAQQRNTRPDSANPRTAMSYDSAMARIRARRDSIGRIQQRQDTTRARGDSTRIAQDTSRNNYFLNSRADSLRPVSGLFASPFGYYCPTQENTICPTIRQRPTAIDSPRTRADSLQTRTPRTADSAQQRSYLHSVGYLTTAGNGSLLENPVLPLTFPADLRTILSADSGVRFSARPPREYLRSVARNQDDSPRGRVFRQYLENLARTIPSGDAASRARLNQALRNDAIITEEEARRVREGPVALIAQRGHESFGGIFYITHDTSSADARRYQQALRSIIANYQRRIMALEDSLSATRDSLSETRESRTRPDTTGAGERNRTRRDSIANEVERARRHDKTPGFRAGLEAQFGTNEELALGAFADARVISGIRLGLFANYSIPSLRGELYLFPVSADTTQRATQLIGPATYETRTDEIRTHANEEGRAEAGASLILTPSKYFEIFGTAGAKLLKRNETIDGISTIETETNGLPRQPAETITGTRENSSYEVRPSFSAGIRINPVRRISIEGSLSRTGGQNRGKAGLRFNF